MNPRDINKNNFSQFKFLVSFFLAFKQDEFLSAIAKNINEKLYISKIKEIIEEIKNIQSKCSHLDYYSDNTISLNPFKWFKAGIFKKEIRTCKHCGHEFSP